MSKFKVLAGNHVENNVKFEAGSVIESDSDLIAMFPNKFQLVVEPTIVTVKAAVDVTVAFPGADETFHKVFAVDGGFNVVDEDDKSMKPINTEGPATTSQVQSFIDGALRALKAKAEAATENKTE